MVNRFPLSIYRWNGWDAQGIFTLFERYNDNACHTYFVTSICYEIVLRVFLSNVSGEKGIYTLIMWQVKT